MEFFTAASKSPRVTRPVSQEPARMKSALLIYPRSTLVHHHLDFFEGQAQHHMGYSYRQTRTIMNNDFILLYCSSETLYNSRMLGDTQP